MLGRIRSIISRVVLLLLLIGAITLPCASSTPEASSKEQSDEDKGQSPRFVLVEEHHHVVSHLVQFAREGYLHSHTNQPRDERNPQGAILIHIDSHADMGLTPGLNKLPAKTIFSNLPPENTDEDLQLLKHSLINDFLLLLGYMGIVDHIIFVEPPWSLLLHYAHYTTVDISIGVVPGKATYGSIRNSPSTIFSKEELSEDAMSDLAGMMSDDDEPVEIVPHEELLQHCPTHSDHCKLRTVQFTTLPYHGAAEAIQKMLETTENRDRDVVLDVDLDGFSTTSPGAQALFETTIPDFRVLTRIYHTVHHKNLCDMGEDYWEQFRTGGRDAERDDGNCESQDLSFVQGPSFRPSLDDDTGSLDYKIVSTRARRLVDNVYGSEYWDKEIVQSIGEVFEYYLPAIDATIYDDDDFVILINSFLAQPFFVPRSQTIAPVIDFHVDQLFRPIFADNNRVPKVINVVRSPFYTPDHHLDFIECTVFERLLEMFGKNSTSSSFLYHADEVHVDRTNCLHEENKFPHPNRINTGENPYDNEMWRSTNMVYSLFYEEDDDSFGTDYKYEYIDVTFTNEHEYSLLVKKSNDGQTLRVLPGESLIDHEVLHLTRWEVFGVTTEKQTQPKSSFLTIVFNGKHGDQQSYSSVSGRMLGDGTSGYEL